MTETVVLLAESDILVRDPLAAYLRDCGFQVLEAANGSETRTFVADKDTRIDIVLLDAAMPDENGFELALWIRGQPGKIEVILAANAEAATRKAGNLCEEEPSVAKPYDHSLVLARIRRAMAARDRKTLGA
ncbi:response regulator transcription factor [Novosphingobium percolationis]|uniref:response regulator transcription factor n=1 Tax=Novosphingobium percolationis TaxID=2871811 RepID=UPI001CD2B58D|nr:response regulator [Novosphingobium percolationis]